MLKQKLIMRMNGIKNAIAIVHIAKWNTNNRNGEKMMHPNYSFNKHLLPTMKKLYKN